MMKQLHVPFYSACLGVSLLVALTACEREVMPYANKPASLVPSSSIAAGPELVKLSGEAHIAAVAPKGADAPVDGAALFVKNCSACHQSNGMGIPGAFPPLADSVYVTSDNTDRLVSIMLYGLQGPIQVNGITYSGVMTPFGALMNDKEVAAVATYIRSSWGHSAGAVDPETVEKMRRKWGERGLFTIAELGEEPGA